jgi:tetratricopeptide (TPR) repeat protein
VFRDIDAIDPGARFGEVIGERIGGCDVLVALIGKGWLEAKDADGRRRLDLPRDFVKAEIAAALTQGKLVIPALIEGTPMPARESLPEELASLVERNALPISDSRFDFDVGRLIAAIDKALAPGGSAPGSTVPPRRTGLWARLSEARIQRTLAFVGAGVAALVGATWTAYLHFSEKPTPQAPAVIATQGGIAAGGNVTATAAQGGVAVVATGPVTIGITLAEYEEQIRKRERELREEFAATSRADKEKVALLEKQLAAAEAQVKSPEQGLEKYKEVLANASRSLQQLGATVPTEELDGARQALARGDTTGAERLFQKVLGQDKVRAAEAAYQLGQLAESRIDYATAAKYFSEAAKLQPENLQYLNAAGRMAYTLGRYGDAEHLLEQSLAIRKKALGPEHPDVATSLNNLAILYGAQGLYAKAEPLYQQSLDIRQKALGPEHPDVAMSLTGLASLYHTQGLYAKAEPLYQKALDIRKKALGPEHPDVAASLNNLALLYATQGLYAKAEPLYRESLAITKKALGPEHPDVATILNNLAELYDNEFLYAKAEPLYKEALDIRKKALGPEHPAVADLLENYAKLLTHLKRDKEASDLQVQAKVIRGIAIIKK